MYPPTNKEELIVPKKITAKLLVPKKYNVFLSILIGLIFAGVFCSGVYIFADSPQTVAPGSSTPPDGCEPGNCNVAAPLTNGFSGSFSGNGDLTTSGSFHVHSDNTYQYFGSNNQARIYFDGTNLTLDPGGALANTLTIGATGANDTFYNLKFNTTTNPSTIQYSGSTKTFKIGNDDGNIVTMPELQIKNSGGVVYTLPTSAPTVNGQTLVGNTDGTVAWGSVSGSETDWTNTGAHLFTTGTGIFGLDSEVTLGGASYAVDISRNGIRMNSSLLYLGLSSSDPTIYSSWRSVYLFNATQLSLGSANLTTTGTGSFGNANLADNTYAINATGNVNVTGNIIASGNISGGSMDPAFVLYDSETEADVKTLADKVVGNEKKTGAVLFYNQTSGQMEVYMPTENQFYQLGSLSLLQNGTVGNGTVSGVSTNGTISGAINSALSVLGITISNGVTNIETLATKNFSADTASVKYLQMTAPNGDIYCTWIDNDGNLQKAKGNCTDVGTMVATSAEPVMNVSSQVVAQATQFVSQVQQTTQQAQQVAQQANETAEQAKQIAQQANDTANSAQQVSQQIQSKILLNIFSVSPISDISVAYGTVMSPTILPTTVTTTLSDNTTQDLSITWDNGTPTYNPNVAGTYVFSGTLTLANNIINNNNLEPKVNVIVAENSNPTPTPTPSPTPNAGQQAASSLLNGVWGFVKFLSTVVTAPLKGMFGK